MDIKTKYCGTKVLITGASGFIGKNLIQSLSNLEIELHTISRKKNKTDSIDLVNHIVDIREKEKVADIIHEIKPDYIFHLAADKNRCNSVESLYAAIDTNLIGTLNIYAASLDIPNLKSVIVLGTAEEYGHNVSPFFENMREQAVSSYSLSKTYMTHLSEYFWNTYHLPVTVIRPTICYGPYQDHEMFIPSLITALLQGKQFKMTKGEQTRDFIYIDDLIEALLIAAETECVKGKIINIGSGQPVKIFNLAKLIESKIQQNNLIKFGEYPYRQNEIQDYSADISYATNVLNWKPTTTLEEGINKTIAYYDIYE